MFAQTLSTDHSQTLKVAVQAAVSALASGEVVALPTETVYGLAADVTNPAALAWAALAIPVVIFYVLKIRLRRVRYPDNFRAPDRERSLRSGRGIRGPFQRLVA